MNRGRTWNVDSHVCLNVICEEGIWVYEKGGKRVSPLLEDYLNTHMSVKDFLDGVELVVEFNSDGWYTPASMYGGADHLGWPEEGGDERTLNQIRVNGIVISQNIAEYVWEDDTVFDAVQAADLE